MSQEQLESLIRQLLGPGGLAGAWLLSRGFTDTQLTTLQVFLVAGTAIMPTIVASVWGFVKSSLPGRKATMANLPASDKADVLSKLSAVEKTAVVEALPTSDKLAAVEAMPQVESIVVSRDATGGVAAAAHDDARPKVVMSNGLAVAGGRDGM